MSKKVEVLEEFWILVGESLLMVHVNQIILKHIYLIADVLPHSIFFINIKLLQMQINIKI